MRALYLLTGAAGHLGTALAHQLSERGCAVRALVLPSDTNAAHLAALPGVEVVCGDVCDAQSLKPFFANPDDRDLIVIHAAGVVSIASRHIQSVHDVNVGGTKNILALCQKHKVKRLVYVSSVHAIPEAPAGTTICEAQQFDPSAVCGLYAKTKAEATQCVLDAARAGLNACVVHPSGIIGPYDYGRGHLTQLILDYLRGRLTACVKGGYDFADVRDVAAGILACCERGEAGACYILSGQYVCVQDLLFRLHQLTGKHAIKTVLPLWFARLTAPLSELYYKILRQPPLYTAYSLYTLSSNAAFSHEKASRQLGYQPRALDETLLDTVRWLKQQRRIP